MAVPSSARADPKKALVWRMVEEGFNKGNPDIVREVCHPRYRNDTSVMAVPDGPEGLAQHIRNARATIDGIRLNIVDIVAEGDRAAVFWQTRGTAGRYLGDSGSPNDTSAWLIGHCGFEDGLIRDHVINWEPLRLMAQGGALDNLVKGAAGRRVADVEPMGLKALRFQAYATYAGEAEATAARPAAARDRATVARAAEGVLRYAFGITDAAPDVAPDAYFSFADFPDQRGAAGLAARRAALTAAFSRVEARIDATVVESGRAILRWTLTCVNSGPWLGLPATGRTLAATGSAYARVEKGRVTEWIELVDVLRLIRQAGGFAAVMPGCYPDQ